MEKLNNLYNIIFGIIFLSSSFLSAQLSLNVNLIKTGQYNLSDFLDPSVSLWTVNVNCNGCAEDKPVFYYMEVRFNFNEINPAIWGITYKRKVSLGNPDILSNFDFQDGLDLFVAYAEDAEFMSLLEENYYLPAGEVTLQVKAYMSENFDYDINSYSISGTLLDAAEVKVENNVVSELKLLSPANNADVLDPYPWLRWESPGFISGVSIDYTLYVYLFNPSFHSSYSDAIEDDNFLYFTKSITQDETGIPKQIQIQYPSDDRDLSCGYQYVWYVTARDIIQDSPFDGESGIWGWPEPIKSPLYVFNYGSIINANNVVSPSIGSETSTVLPTFYVDPVDCADSYEIWLSFSEDSDVENPIWTSGALQTNVNVYPSDATGLMPGSNYKWKIRVNPDGEPSPWSDIFDFMVMGYTLDDPASGQVLNTISPTFSLTGPSDIAGFELHISNVDDPMVESGNIFNEYVQSFPFNLPTDISVGLLPGDTYFWKVLFLDGNENIVGDIDDYTTIESFSIEGIELNSPSDGASDLSLTPSFIWEGPSGVEQYEYFLSTDDDPSIENPMFTTNVSGTFFQYSQHGDFPLEYKQIYYWKVVPLDINENRGASSEPYSFSTANDISEVVIDNINKKPQFSLTNGPEDSPKDIILNLLAGVSKAEEYIILFSDKQEMESVLAELTIEAKQKEVTLNGKDFDWGLAVYVQAFAMADGEIIGEKSLIKSIKLPEKPGSGEQIGIAALLEEGTTQLSVELTNLITNASDYIIEVASDVDMNEIFFTGPASVDLATICSASADPSMYGNTYYIQVFATDDDGFHGLPSTVIPIFIPNIKPPVLKDKFSWEATVPASNSYTIQISITDDFSSIKVEESIAGTALTLSEEILNSGTIYYWRVQGYDIDGIQFGDVSNILSFKTKGEQKVVKDIEGGQIVILKSPSKGTEVTTLQPSFQWDIIESAEEYEIKISANEDYSQIMWQSRYLTQNSVKYPSQASEILLTETIYYWSVRCIAEDIALGAFSESFTFTVSDDNRPVLTGPMNGISESMTPYFTWNKIPRAKSYGLVLGNNENLSPIIFENHRISDKYFQYTADSPPLKHDTAYYWKVIAYDENTNPIGDYSAITTFTTPTGIVQIEFIYENKNE